MACRSDRRESGVGRPLIHSGQRGRGVARSVSVLEAPAGVAGFDDVAVVRQPVEHGGCHFRVPKNLRPVCEGEICGDQQRGVFIELADQVEQQLAPGLAERQITEFVNDDEIVAQQILGQPTTTTRGLFLFQLIDEIDEVEEAPPGARSNDGRGYGDAQMGFACARRSSVTMPGVRRARFGSPIRFTLARARLLWRWAIAAMATATIW